MIILPLILNLIIAPNSLFPVYSQPASQNLHFEKSETIDDLASDNTSNGSLVFLTYFGGKITAFDLLDKQKRWTAEFGGQIIAAPLIFDEEIYVARKSESSVSLNVLGKFSGVTRLQTEVPFDKTAVTALGKAFLYRYGSYLIFISDNGKICSLSIRDGRLAWSANLNRRLTSAPYLVNDRLFFGTADKKIIGVSLEDGSQIADIKISAVPTFITNDRIGDSLIIGDANGELVKINRKKNSLNRWFRFGGEISGIVQTSEGLLVSSLDNFVYLISEAKNKLIWKKRLLGRVSATPLFNNEYVLITTADATYVSIINLRDGKLFDRISVEKGDLFTGKNIRSGDFFIYATQNGFLSFSLPTKVKEKT